jgi:hypothetical protein
MNAFVGISQRFLSADELQESIEKLVTEPSYYFLRWAHKVSGIVRELYDFPSPEGQMFNSILELRWRQKRPDKYEAMLLSIRDGYPDFNPLDGAWEAWEAEDRNAYFYPKTETRFPKGLVYPDDLNIAQRLFKDKKTATVHFVALTIGEKS